MVGESQLQMLLAVIGRQCPPEGFKLLFYLLGNRHLAVVLGQGLEQDELGFRPFDGLPAGVELNVMRFDLGFDEADHIGRFQHVLSDKLVQVGDLLDPNGLVEYFEGARSRYANQPAESFFVAGEGRVKLETAALEHLLHFAGFPQVGEVFLDVLVRPGDHVNLVGLVVLLPQDLGQSGLGAGDLVGEYGQQDGLNPLRPKKLCQGRGRIFLTA